MSSRLISRLVLISRVLVSVFLQDIHQCMSRFCIISLHKSSDKPVKRVLNPLPNLIVRDVTIGCSFGFIQS